MLDLCDWSDKYLSSPEMKATTELAGHELAWCIGKHRAICPKANIDYLEGNHEKRWVNALLKNIQAAYGIYPYSHNSEPKPKYPLFSIPTLLGLDKIDVNYLGDYPDGDLWLGKGCRVHHGTKAKSFGGETAKSYLRDCDYSVIYGHLHKNEIAWFTSHVQGDIKYRFASSPGTFAAIGGRIPAVNKTHNWQNGMMVITYDPDGYDINPELIPIINGEMIYQGEKFVGNFPLDELCDDTGHDYYVGLAA
jgi:hypothetical protein